MSPEEFRSKLLGYVASFVKSRTGCSKTTAIRWVIGESAPAAAAREAILKEIEETARSLE